MRTSDNNDGFGTPSKLGGAKLGNVSESNLGGASFSSDLEQRGPDPEHIGAQDHAGMQEELVEFELPFPSTEQDSRVSFTPAAVVDKGAGVYGVTLRPGYVIEHVPESSDPAADSIQEFMPIVAGDPDVRLDADEPPEILMSVGDYLYCVYNTDKTGAITEEEDQLVRVVVSADDEKGQHYQPIQPAGVGGAVDGVYYVKLLQLAPDGDGGVLAEVYQQGDIEHFHVLPTIVNVGGGSALFQQRNAPEGTYEMRSIPEHYGLFSEKLADEVHLKLKMENDGEGAPLYKPPVDGSGDAITDEAALPNESAKLRSLKISSPLENIMSWVDVADEDEEVYLKSDGVNSDYVDLDGGSITFVAGVASAFTNPTNINHLNLLIRDHIYDTTTVDGVVDVMTRSASELDSEYYLYWRNGRFMGKSLTVPLDTPAGLVTEIINSMVEHTT